MWNAHDHRHGWERRGWHFMPWMPFLALFVFIALFKVAWWLPFLLVAILWSGAAGSCGHHHGGKRKRWDGFTRPDGGWRGWEEKEKRKRGEDEYI